MAEDVFPEPPDNLVKVCKSQDDCDNARSYACKFNIPITDFGNLPLENIKVNETRLIIPKSMIDRIEKKHEWNSLNPMWDMLEQNVIVAEHNVDEDNYGFLIVDKPTFMNDILTADSVFRNKFK